jgi:hypothetical protein
MLPILLERKYIENEHFEFCYKLAVEHTNIILKYIRFLKTKL